MYNQDEGCAALLRDRQRIENGGREGENNVRL
jgi:hypothetical protein